MDGLTPAGLLDRLAARGIHLRIRDGFLVGRGPKAQFTDSLRALVEHHRQELLDRWRCLECGVITTALYGMGSLQRCRECSDEGVEVFRVPVQTEPRPTCICGEIGMAPRCPGCGTTVPHPRSLDHDTTTDWYCWPCLNRRVVA